MQAILHKAILLVGHGTRNLQGQEQFLSLAGRLRAALAPTRVEVAYIELQSPTIDVALLNLQREGFREIVLAPALLFAAGHAKQDIPAAVARALQQADDLQATIAEPLGCHEAVLDLAAIRFGTHLAPRDERSWPSASDATSGDASQNHPLPVPAATLPLATFIARSEMSTENALVLIGRGSSDLTAIAHCEEFASQLAARQQINKVFTGFIAIAKPSLPTVLDQAAASGVKQIVVQPHLLFSGEMLDTTATAIAEARKRFPQIDWRQSDSLGADLCDPKSIAADYLVRAIVARVNAAAGPE